MNRRIVPWCRCTAVFIVLTAFATAATAIAQQQTPSAPRDVRSASFQREVPRSAPRNVKFGQYATRIGDSIEQTVSLGMRLTTSLRQGNQLVAKQESTMHGEQQRVIVTTAVESGRTAAVTVHYLQAVKQLDTTDGTTRGAAAKTAAKTQLPMRQPVEGKTYLCRREGGEEGKLTITDAKGNIPPLSEYDIVAQNMEMVGRSNPLAQFLANRSVAVGETLTLPREAADRLFNLGERFGEVQRFDLTLRGVEVEGDADCAVFAVHIEAASSDSSQMRLQVDGQLIVQVASCRAVRTELAGPLALAESRGSFSTAQQLIGTGQLTVRMASVYGAAKP